MAGLASIIVFALLFCAQGADKEKPDDKEKVFQSLCAKAQRLGGADVTEEEIMNVLLSGRELGHPFAAGLAAKTYAARNPTLSSKLLLLFAENAFLNSDFRAAVTRYKSYLNTATPASDSSDAAAILYMILIDFLGVDEDAFQAMKTYGEKFRQSDNAKKYDCWFLEKAKANADIIELAKRLNLILSEKLPAEKEKFFFWDYLNFLMETVRKPSGSTLQVLPIMNQILPQIRADNLSLLKYRFYVANLEFKAGTVGKSGEDVTKAADKVIDAAKAYFDGAPSMETFKDIVGVLSSGFQVTEWQIARDRKNELIINAFGKLAINDKVEIIKWLPSKTGLILNGDQWAALCAASPDAFAKAGHFVYTPTNRDVFVKQAPFLDSVNTPYSAVVKSLAAGSDLDSMARYLVEKESWHMDFKQCYSNLNSSIWNFFSNFPRDEANKLPSDYLNRFTAKFGLEILLKTPLPVFDLKAAGDIAMALWTQNDKKVIPEQLHMFDWIPYTEKEREAVFGPAYAAFKAWVDVNSKVSAIRDAAKAKTDLYERALASKKAAVEAKAAAEAKAESAAKAAAAANATAEVKAAAEKAAAEAAAAGKAWNAADVEAARSAGPAAEAKDVFAQIGSISQAFDADVISAVETAFKEVMNINVFNAEKAPNPLCKNIALAVISIREKKQDDFIKIARQIYPEIKDYAVKKTPWGSAILKFLTSNHQDSMDTLDFQLEVLSDQLSVSITNSSVSLVLNAIISGRKGWPGAAAASDREKVKKLSDVLEKALAINLDKGLFSQDLFNFFCETRHGDGWKNDDAGLAVMSKMIDKKVLFQASSATNTAACQYMRLIRNEFPKLNDTYPANSYFDDMYCEECSKTQALDWNYWTIGTDQKGKICNLATRLLQKYTALPCSFNSFNSADDLWKWHGQCLRMNATWRKERQIDENERNKLITMLENSFGQTRFDEFAMGDYYFFADADLATQEGRKQFFEKTALFTSRMQTVPTRVSLPSFAAFSKINSLTDAELSMLMRIFPDRMPWKWTTGRFFELLPPIMLPELMAKKRYTDMFVVIPCFWKMAKDMNNAVLFRKLAEIAQDLKNQNLDDLAAVGSISGLELAMSLIPDDVRISLTGTRVKSQMNIGGAIPVEKTDPRYNIFAAQNAYLSGNYQNAWELYQSTPDRVSSMFKELDLSFCLWLIEKNTEMRNFAAAESLAKSMIPWIDSLPEGFDKETRARLKLLYGDIASAQREYPKARALYERIIASKEFDGTKAQNEAELKIANVDRLTRNFEGAIMRLEKLLRKKDHYLQIESAYLLALVKYDQEDYDEASKYLNMVFALEPNHEKGRILYGYLDLKLKRYLRATDIKVGLSSSQRILVPNKPLKVSLDDRNLVMAGKTPNIEVRAWTDSGDEEIFSLLASSDSKTMFEGQLSTALGPIVKGDHVLQILGNDKIHYDFSDKFKQIHNITDSEPTVLTVASDAIMQVSSGKILTESEEQQNFFNLMMSEEGKGSAIFDAIRSFDIVRPGNGIYVRITDPDASISKEKDNVALKVTSFSGDSMPNFPLEETDPFSGVFTGVIPTTPAGAMAYASDSDEGKLPNYVISPNNQIPWIGMINNIRPKFFCVDVNDNILLGKMSILADIPGRKLKSFLVQTSVNRLDFATVGSWPNQYVAWDGTPVFDFVTYTVKDAPTSCDAIRRYIESESVGTTAARVTVPAVKLLYAQTNLCVQLKEQNIPLAWNSDYFVAHLRAAFYVPAKQLRTFKLDHKNKLKNIAYYFAIDGVDVKEKTLASKQPLKKGVHFIDVYIYSHRNANGVFDLMGDSDQPPYMIPCPLKIFDPAQNAEIKNALPKTAAVVSANPSATLFEVQFPTNLQSRVIRLVLADFETDAPAIKSINLTDASGNTILPTTNNLLLAAKNQVLEIVPGDKISISYHDKKFISKDKEILEKMMHANYNNAVIFACTDDFYKASRDEYFYYHNWPAFILQRFRPGEKINAAIIDKDCDVSDKKDIIFFSAKTELGKPVQLKALETHEHSGVFFGAAFTTKGKPQRPDEIQIEQDENLVLLFDDKENTDPGIPWARKYVVQQVAYDTPDMRIYDVTSIPVEKSKLQSLPAEISKERQKGTIRKAEFFAPTRELLAVRPMLANSSTNPARVLIDVPLLVELTYPAAALSAQSKAGIYLQTSSARKTAGVESNKEFNSSVPGTLYVEAVPGDFKKIDPPPGYLSITIRGDPYASSAFDMGRFSFIVNKEFGSVSAGIAAIKEHEEKKKRYEISEDPPLFVQGNDTIYVGFKFEDTQGKTNWLVQTVEPQSDIFFDVMDRYYNEVADKINIGENLYFRMVSRALDTSEQKDAVSVSIKTASGYSTNVTLVESVEHSGIFKGWIQTALAQEKISAGEMRMLPVNLGDAITAFYKPPANEKEIARVVQVNKGADGKIIPFSKSFKNPEIAAQTQFIMAEAYFELAKKHRTLDQESLARREIAQGKKLLEEALKDYPGTDLRVQAEFLLADLALEYANDAKDTNLKRQKYYESVNLFTKIIATYPNSVYAPKAQYKKALAFENLGEIDQACEEYVKLSYTYPESDLIAETIARLGNYFASKGKDFAAQVAKAGSPAEKEKNEKQAQAMYKTAAEVFGRLAPRFPSHDLASKTMVLSGQCFMQANEMEKAVDVFQNAIKKSEGKNELLAEAMYWRSDCYMKLKKYDLAYRQLKQLTWDYPASKWAKFARGRLSEDALVKYEERVTGQRK